MKMTIININEFLVRIFASRTKGTGKWKWTFPFRYVGIIASMVLQSIGPGQVLISIGVAICVENLIISVNIYY